MLSPKQSLSFVWSYLTTALLNVLYQQTAWGLIAWIMCANASVSTRYDFVKNI